MKSVIAVILLVVAGCYYSENSAPAAAQGFNQGLQNAYMMDAYGRRNEGQMVYPQPNYWQEQRAKQEYQQNALKFPPMPKPRLYGY